LINLRYILFYKKIEMFKQLYKLVRNIFSQEPLEEAISIEFSIYDAISIGVILVVVWWVLFY